MLYACQVATPFLITTLPAVLADRTVTGTYRCAPESASSRSMYEPAGQAAGLSVSDGSQSVWTGLVGPMRAGSGWRCPGTRPDCQTLRAPAPPYQPIRNAVTRNPGDVVETNSGNDSPVVTLAWPAYPSMSCCAPRCVIGQPGSPGRAFSSTGAARRGVARGRLAAAGLDRKRTRL